LYIAEANTEGFLRYHRFHERFNRSIKVQVIGVGLLTNAIEDGRTVGEIRIEFDRQGGLWGGMPDWSEPSALINEARLDIGRAGVVAAFSAFDLFLDETAADLERWRAFRKKESPIELSSPISTGSAEGPDRVERYYHDLGETIAAVNYLWPVYRYFRLARDCIVHRDGIASDAAAQASMSDDLHPVLSHWVKNTKETQPPEVLPLVRGQKINFTHRHAISASSVLRLLARDVNRKAINKLERSGFVYLAAHKGFLISEPLFDGNTGRTMLRALNNLLADRYRVRKVSEMETARTLRSLGLTKKCTKQFEKIRDFCS
jgi:hypothetical protein